MGGSLAGVAWGVVGLTNGHGRTTTDPVAPGALTMPGAGSVVVWDDAQARSLFDQLRQVVATTATQVG